MMEANNEKFNFFKFISGFTQPVNAAKSIVFGVWIFLFIVIGYTFYRAYIKKQPPATTQNAEKIENRNYYLQPHAFGCARLIIPPEKR